MGTNHPEQKFWSLFCRTTGQDELIDDPRYAEVSERTSRSKELVQYFEGVFSERTRDEWPLVASPLREHTFKVLH